jgi:hypothetical protein
LPIIREPLPRLFVLEIKIDDGELDPGRHADERIRPKLPPRVDLIGIAARVVESVRRKRLLVRAAREDRKLGCQRKYGFELARYPDSYPGGILFRQVFAVARVSAARAVKAS